MKSKSKRKSPRKWSALLHLVLWCCFAGALTFFHYGTAFGTMQDFVRIAPNGVVSDNGNCVFFGIRNSADRKSYMFDSVVFNAQGKVVGNDASVVPPSFEVSMPDATLAAVRVGDRIVLFWKDSTFTSDLYMSIYSIKEYQGWSSPQKLHNANLVNINTNALALIGAVYKDNDVLLTFRGPSHDDKYRMYRLIFDDSEDPSKIVANQVLLEPNPTDFPSGVTTFVDQVTEDGKTKRVPAIGIMYADGSFARYTDFVQDPKTKVYTMQGASLPSIKSSHFSDWVRFYNGPRMDQSSDQLQLYTYNNGGPACFLYDIETASWSESNELPFVAPALGWVLAAGSAYTSDSSGKTTRTQLMVYNDSKGSVLAFPSKIILPPGHGNSKIVDYHTEYGDDPSHWIVNGIIWGPPPYTFNGWIDPTTGTLPVDMRDSWDWTTVVLGSDKSNALTTTVSADLEYSVTAGLKGDVGVDFIAHANVDIDLGLEAQVGVRAQASYTESVEIKHDTSCSQKDGTFNDKTGWVLVSWPIIQYTTREMQTVGGESLHYFVTTSELVDTYDDKLSFDITDRWPGCVRS